MSKKIADQWVENRATRRDWITRGAVLSGLAVVGTFIQSETTLAADDKKKNAKKNHHHHVENPFQKAIDSAAHCVQKGEACVAHCQWLIEKGDTSMADCLRTALEMVAGCQALIRLGNLQSKSIKKMAAVCAELCRECEKTCQKHEEHAVCQACMEACGACAKECDKIS